MKKLENKLTPARELVPALSERVDWAIRRAMHSNPDQRPASCREFVEDLTGHSTRKLAVANTEPAAEVWHLRYRDGAGVLHTVKGSLAEVRDLLREGVPGDADGVRAARNNSNVFEPLKNLPEFRDLALATFRPTPAAATPRPTPPRPAAAKPAAPRPPAPRPRKPPTQTAPSPAPFARDVEGPARPAEVSAPQILLQPVEVQPDWAKIGLFLLLAVGAGVGGFLALAFLPR
jgi:hypothetical protein